MGVLGLEQKKSDVRYHRTPTGVLQLKTDKPNLHFFGTYYYEISGVKI